MSRPSKNTDRLLIEAAKELIPEAGFKGLKIRDVARKAGVNLGMFNYHFKTKEKFIEILISEVYGEFLKGLLLSSSKGNNSLENLKNVLIEIAVFVRNHSEIVQPLFEEIVSGNKRMMDFAKANLTRHISILLDLIKKCQKEDFVRKDIRPFNILINALVPAVLPSVMAKVIEKYYMRPFFGILTGPFKAMILSDRALEQRIDMALKGVSAE